MSPVPARAGADPSPWITLGIIVGAFAGSVGHIYDVTAEHGAGWIVTIPGAGAVSLMAVLIAALPEAQVYLCVLRVLRGGLTPTQAVIVAVYGLSAVAFTVLANLATVPPGEWAGAVGQWPGWAAVVAVWPAWSGIGAAALLDPSSLTRRRTPTTTPKRPAAPVRGAAPDASDRRAGPVGSPPRPAGSPVPADRSEAPTPARRAPRQDAVLAAVADGPRSRAEIAEQTGLDRDAVKPVIRALREKGQLQQVGDGPATVYAAVNGSAGAAR